MAIFGSTGIVGQEILSLLAEGAQELGQIQLSASDDSVGEYYDFCGAELEVMAVERMDFSQPTLSVLCAPKDVSQKLLDSLLDKSLAVIDCSGLDRVANNLKLLPHSLSVGQAKQAYFLRTAPGYMLTNFFEIAGLAGKVRSLVATCLEPVSGAGRAGLDELWTQLRSIFAQTPCDPEFFPEQIAFNLLPYVDLMREDGSTAMEKRIADELEAAGINIQAAAISTLRVPTMYGSAVTFSFQVDKSFSLPQLVDKIAEDNRFALGVSEEIPPSTLSALGNEKIHVGRLRSAQLGDDLQLISGWLASDNIRGCIARPIADVYRSLMPLS